MAAARVCSEWGLAPNCQGSLAGKSVQAVTCSVACRQHRARRLRKARVDSRALEATRGVRDLVRAGGQDAVQEVLKQELAPLVRESIDEDVIAAISKMVGLTTRAVEVLAADLDSEDKVMRQRAAALVVKYTVGHPALVKSSDETHTPLEIHFNLPRPDGTVETPLVDAEGEPLEETQVCDTCKLEKPLAEFVAGSDRCEQCFREARQRILSEFGLET